MRKYGLLACYLLFALYSLAQQEQPYNRFQYHKYKWKVIHQKTYHIYFPNGCDTLAYFTAKETSLAIATIKKRMLTDVLKPPNLIIYPSIDQLYESNIGSYELQHYTLPTFVTKAGRLLIAFNGSYTDFNNQLYEVLARYQWESNLQDQVTGKENEKPLLWFKEGAIRYFAHEWPIKEEQLFSKSFEQNIFQNWQQVLSYEPRLAGQAFCYYLSLNYQKKVVAQIFLQLKKGKNLSRAARLITKNTLDGLQTDCFMFYQKRFEDSKQGISAVITIPHKKGIINAIIFPSDKSYVHYFGTLNNHRSVYSFNIKANKTKKICSYPLPPWIDDHSLDKYPLLDWKDNTLYIATPIKGNIVIRKFDVNGKRVGSDKLPGIDGVTDFSNLSSNQYLLAAYRKGTKGNVIYDIAKEKYFISDKQGNKSETNYTTTKDSIRVSMPVNSMWVDLDKPGLVDTPIAWLTDFKAMQVEKLKEDSLLQKGKDTAHYLLDNVFGNKTSGIDTSRKKEVKPESYILQLHSAYFSTKVNNDYLMNRYQPYLNYQGQFKFPELGGMAEGGFTDIFENHHFTVGYRLPAVTSGSDFFAQYDNTEKKLDWGLVYYRTVDMLQPGATKDWKDASGNLYPASAKVKTNYYSFSLHYPLTYYSSFEFKAAIRKDRTIFLATDKYSLDYNSIESLWSITTLSYKVSKLQKTLPLLFKGFKAEVKSDVFKGFSQQEALVLGNTVDLFYHQPLYKYITLVTQLHAGYSTGDQKVLYNFGGVDNNVTPKVDTSIHFRQDAPYAFQTLVTPFRGYYQNSLYGNEYVLLNADIYFPLFQTLIPITTPLPFINNLQLGMFTDYATAKETWNSVPPKNNYLSSFGLSTRSSLAGYPIRIDVAWPGSLSKQPVWYFSLNLL